VIQFNHVTKSYENGQVAVNNINLTLESGEMAYLKGHSGAGKTTLLKLIMMIETVSRGQIILNNENISRARGERIAYIRRQIGMIFQNPPLLFNRTVFENVALPLIVAGYRPKEIKRRVNAALDKVSLLHKQNSSPRTLSTGEQQRVGIARAVVTKPSILLADEPTGNLDPELSAEILKLFEAFNKVGVTVLIATHDFSLIQNTFHRVITLEGGQIIKDSHHEFKCANTVS